MYRGCGCGWLRPEAPVDSVFSNTSSCRRALNVAQVVESDKAVVSCGSEPILVRSELLAVSVDSWIKSFLFRFSDGIVWFTESDIGKQEGYISPWCLLRDSRLDKFMTRLTTECGRSLWYGSINNYPGYEEWRDSVAGEIRTRRYVLYVPYSHWQHSWRLGSSRTWG